MAPDRVYPDAGAPTAPPPGAYYNLKNQQMPAPATYRQRRRGRSPCCCCFIWLFSILTILAILVGLAVLIFWLVVRPKAPQFDLEQVQITGIVGAQPPYNTSIDYQIKAYNPNKRMGFYYSDINVKVESSGDIVGQGTVASFYQGHKNTTILTGSVGQTDVTLSSSDQTSIASDPSNVPFYAEVDLKVKVKVGSIKSRNVKVTVKCDVTADLTKTSSQLNSSKCKVHW